MDRGGSFGEKNRRGQTEQYPEGEGAGGGGAGNVRLPKKFQPVLPLWDFLKFEALERSTNASFEFPGPSCGAPATQFPP